jgi:23S rRNA pseudouridine1911/1915/1917 synthase
VIKKELKVLDIDQGKRLDKFLSEKISGISRQKIIHCIENGKVAVDGVIKKASYRILSQQSVELRLNTQKQQLEPYPYAINILYEDDDLLVVDKPAGLTVHPPHYGYKETLVNALLYQRVKLYGSDPIRPGIVHRLDKETSGVMVVAKSQLAYLSLVGQFKAREVKKEYRALCHGVIKEDFISTDLPLARDKKNRLKMKISLLDSKEALTEINVLRRLGNSTYISLRILTGRMHQIRVHMKFLGYPLIGDKKYGVKDGFSGLFLHALKLGFSHPKTKEFLEFNSSLPKIFSEFITNEARS